MRILILSNDRTISNAITEKFSAPKQQIKTICKIRNLNDVKVALTSFKPEIIILDDDMLRPDSPKVLQMIRQINKHISVTFLTANPGIELGRRITQFGVQFYSYKPIETNKLCEALSSMIRKLKKQRLTF